jgi:hypothetical protein
LSPNTHDRLPVSEIFNHIWVNKHIERNKESTIDITNSSLIHNSSDKLFDMVINRIQKKNSKKQIRTLDRISPIQEINEENYSILRDIKEIGRQIESKDSKYPRRTKTDIIEKGLFKQYDDNDEWRGISKRTSSNILSSSQRYRNKINCNNTSNECSTQTEVKEESTWSKFMKIFQCGG